MLSKYCGLHVILMTNYPLLTETSLITDCAVTNHADYLGYELLG